MVKYYVYYIHEADLLISSKDLYKVKMKKAFMHIGDSDKIELHITYIGEL